MRKTFWMFCAAVLVFCAIGCATEPEPLDRTQPEALNKKMFTGEWYYKMTVVDTEWQNTYTFPGEETSTYAGFAFKARWEITQDLLNAYMIPQRYRDRNGNLIENRIGQRSMILSFRIKKHYDIRYAYNQTTREDLNVIVENTDRPWNEREYMEVDWSQSLVSNLANPTQLDTATGELVREPVAVWENVEFFTHSRTPEGAIDTDNANDVKIDTRKWNPLADPEVHAVNIDLKEVISQHLTDWLQFYYGPYMPPVTIKTRHSLMKATPIDAQTYRPADYRDEKFRRFGFFRTEYDVWDPERGALEGNKQYLINRWDFTNGKKLYWYASPDFQEQINEGDLELKAIALSVVFEWNQVIREALGLPAKAPVVVDNIASVPAETLIQLYAPAADDPMQFRENLPLLDANGKQVTTADGTKRWRYELGDLRYSFINFIKMSPDASPLGYGPSTPDADTGEIVSATLNAYGNWVDFVVRRAMDQYDAASGNCTLDQLKDGFYFDPNTGLCDSRLFVGEYKGGVLGSGTASLTTASPSAPPKQPQRLHQLTPALMTSYWPHSDIRRPIKKPTKEELAAAEPAMKAAWLREVKNPTALDLGGFQTVAGTRYEAMMVPQANLHTLLPHAPSADHPQVSAALSPARLLSADFLARMKEEATRPGPCKLDASAFEPSIHRFVEEMAGRPRIEVYKALRFWIWYTTALHEMGHNLGIRHNFRGSADQQNFSPEYWTHYNAYWDKVEALRAQYQPLIEAGDPDAYNAYVTAVDQIASPHNRFGSTSIMDYMGDWVKWQVPVGSWDRGAILLGYGDKVEVIDVREIKGSVYSCNGKDGSPPGLMVVSDEPPGENCAAGGKVITCGPDLDGDGILDEVAEGTVTGTEIKTIDYACNGETGVPALVETVAEPAGSICEFGGRKATTGVDVDGDGRLDEGIDRKAMPYASLPWRVVPYQDGDFRQGNVWDDLQVAESGRKVRYYMFCSDEKVFDDAFCTRFDIGVTATEIIRNFIRDSQPSYFFKNFKRQRWNFDNIADGYYINKWAWTYYMYGKSLGEMQLASMRYSDWSVDKNRPQDDFWGSIWDGMNVVAAGPEKRDMIPGYHHNGGEDLLRASLLFYYYLLYDVLGRPDYGYYQLTRGTDAKLFWEATDARFIDTSKPTGTVPTGYGWGWQDKYDQQADVDQYYPHLERIGVELDKIIALEIMSIPAAMNEPLYFEKANGLSFWNSIWTNTGSQAWEVIKGLITDNFSHSQTVWCMKCDANCIADSATYPPQLKAYPVDFMEGLRAAGIVGDQKPSGALRCVPDEYPMQPGMDALFAIFPIFFGISGASHPWYSNNLADHMDSQVKGGNHRFDIPPGSEVAEFTNSTGTKTYQAVKPKDGLGISYDLVENGARIMDRINAVEYCRDWSLYPPDRTCAWGGENYSDEYPCCEDFIKDETTGTCAWPPLPEDLAGRIHHEDCGEIIACLSSFGAPGYCEPEGFDPVYSLDLGALKYRDVDRIEAMLIMMQDMIDLAGHYQWRIPGYLENDW